MSLQFFSSLRMKENCPVPNNNAQYNQTPEHEFTICLPRKTLKKHSAEYFYSSERECDGSEWIRPSRRVKKDVVTELLSTSGGGSFLLGSTAHTVTECSESGFKPVTHIHTHTNSLLPKMFCIMRIKHICDGRLPVRPRPIYA